MIDEPAGQVLRQQTGPWLGLDLLAHRVEPRSANPFVELDDVVVDVLEILDERRLAD